MQLDQEKMKLVADTAKGPFLTFWCFEEQYYWLFYHNIQINLRPLKYYKQVENLIYYLEQKGL